MKDITNTSPSDIAGEEGPLSESMADLFRQSPDLMCVHDLQGRILAANASACQALGYSWEELSGKSLQDLLEPGAKCFFDAYIQTLLSDGIATGRMKVQTRAGDARTWEYRNLIVGRDRVRVAGIARDVTEEDATLRALRDSEHHFRTLVEQGADLTGIIGVGGTVCYFSPSVAHTLHHDPRACLGKSLDTFVHDADRGPVNELIARAFEGDAPAERLEVRMRTRSGAFRSCEVVFTPLVRGRRTTGLLMNARDITERKLLEQQLEQASRLTSLGRLAATVAHEFNNVLMGMLPFVELLQRRTPTAKLLASATQHLSNSIQRGKTVTRDMLRFTRPAEPRIRELGVREWWDRFEPEAQAMIGNDIQLISSVEPLTIMADGDQLSQIFSNLINNARDAMPSGGRLEVRASAPEPGQSFPFGVVLDPSRFVQISIEDTGIGMPEELLRHVFEPLFTTKKHGGTGLGLAVTHQVVTRHGGLIFVESKAGLGTSFHLFLPRVLEPQPIAPAPRLTPALKTRRILLVEDEPAIASGLMDLLGDDFEVALASSGTEALAVVDDFHADLAVLDIGLPDMDGVDVGRLIRQRHPALPIVFATGHGDERDTAIGPLVRLLYKPFELEELMNVIADLERAAAGS